MILCREFVIAKVDMRGAGTPESPSRVVTQIFEKNGELVAESDPHGGYTVEDLARLWAFAKENRGELKDFLHLSLQMP